ncbi:DUF551 domain-containing protein [Acetobacter sp. DmW_136]|uniref:DUF551 domain-containing protein n=1 Tax=Acetobacter sp. DmW_136 TaxID=2591091 RepID=UPI00123AB907|nr:DUF551 domain-containing protein [Acetobacter sp. DmW_136]KAA8387660.1 DUF551 domain-containing protein [Acetobacter sp. DmW_136]
MTDPRIEAAARALYENTVGLEWPRDADDETRADYYEDARIALAAADAAAWRPIETAPQDGTHILVPMKFIGADVVSYELGAWRETTNMLRLKDEPTHWQPLPAPPTGGGNG